MPHIKTDVSDQALVTAIRANLCEFFRHLGRSEPAEQFENEKFARWYSPVQHPWFSGVLSSLLPSPEDEAFIDDMVRYFHAKGTNTFTWWMEPPLRPADWEPVLSKHGFSFSDGTPGMAIDLNDLDESKSKVSGLGIQIVEDAETLRVWVDTFTRGYGLPIEWSDIIFDTWLKLGLDGPVQNYLGYLNGKPVSTSTVFYGAGVAGIYDVATLTEARGQGVGAALTLNPLLGARQAGYRVGILQSSEQGFNVYKKLGFRHLCQIENFYFSPQ